MSELKRISKRSELQQLAKELGVGHDWHEPDNQSVDAFMFGDSFDNAGHWGLRHFAERHYRATTNLWEESPNTGQWNVENPERFMEMFVVLYKEGRAVAEVNLATLFAFACGTFEG